jgi:hypothetical protein
LCIFINCEAIFSQSELIKINQDSKIDTLIELKKQINKSFSNLKIQVFSGERDEARELISKHVRNNYPGTEIELIYETPNYKVWVGNFFSQLQADRELLLVKKKYPEAFIFRPKPKAENNQVELEKLK